MRIASLESVPIHLNKWIHLSKADNYYLEVFLSIFIADSSLRKEFVPGLEQIHSFRRIRIVLRAKREVMKF